MDARTDGQTGKCPVVHGATNVGMRSNSDWWPKRLNLRILRQDAPQLQQALNDAGLKTDSGGLQFSLRDQSSSGQNSGNDNGNPNAQRLIVSDEDAVPAAVAGRSYGRSLGSSSGIDIRV